MADAIETWIDILCKVFRIDNGRGGDVYSFVVFEKNELPAVITPDMIPCAVSYVMGVQPEYSEGGPTIFYSNGQTEFHLTTDVKPANISYLMPFFGRIIGAAAGNMKLSNKVEIFLLNDSADALAFVTYKDAAGNDDHQGIVAKWKVKQNVSGQYTVSR